MLGITGTDQAWTKITNSRDKEHPLSFSADCFETCLHTYDILADQIILYLIKPIRYIVNSYVSFIYNFNNEMFSRNDH